jgi:hypothetical protein
MTVPARNDRHLVDLSDLATDEVEVLLQEGGRGMPEFAASTGLCLDDSSCSCSVSSADE